MKPSAGSSSSSANSDCQMHETWLTRQQVSFDPAPGHEATRLRQQVGPEESAELRGARNNRRSKRMAPSERQASTTQDDLANGLPKAHNADAARKWRPETSANNEGATTTTTTTTTTTGGREVNKLEKAPLAAGEELGSACGAKAAPPSSPLRLALSQTRSAKHPLDAASLISKLFFGWMVPFIWRGWRFGLRQADMPQSASAQESCHRIGEKLVANWAGELKRAGNLSGKQRGASFWRRPDDDEQPAGCSGARKPSLARAVIRTHARGVLLNSLLTIFSEVVCKSLSAYSVGQVLWHINRRQLVEPAHAWSRDDPLAWWAFMLVGAVCCWVLSAHSYGFQMMRVGLHVRVGCSLLIYRKSLRLAQSELSQATVGKMINLLSNDLDKFNYVCIMVPFLWVGPIQTIVSLYLLWPILGFATLGSLLVLAILTPIQFYLSRKFASFRRRVAASTDERVRLLNETIAALQLIKLYAWEYPFQAAMSEARRKETDLINRVSIIKGISVAFMYVSSKLVLFVTIIFHCLIFGGSLDAQTLFMSMAMLNNVQFTMTQLLPRVVSLGVESLVSLGRITDFLLTKEFAPSNKLEVRTNLYGDKAAAPVDTYMRGRPNSCSFNSCVSIITNRLIPPASSPLLSLQQQKASSFNRKLSPLVECANVGARWLKAETKTLKGITFKQESAGLTTVFGSVGSGKSSLFLALLNELPINEGRAHILGSLAYCSQEPWIFDGTVRENILFGQVYCESRYQKILEICALKRDLELLEYGDFTYIQANSLSGGQKARINLARCLYRDCDIYLLDDPFSAIDNHVAGHIFELAIKQFLSHKLVLLATHQVRLLKRSDKILLLDKGEQLAHCNYDELCKEQENLIKNGEEKQEERLKSAPLTLQKQSQLQPQPQQQQQQQQPRSTQNKPDDDKTKPTPPSKQLTSSNLNRRREATSGSTIHAPYGFSNLAPNESGEKTLITVAAGGGEPEKRDRGGEARQVGSYKATSAAAAAAAAGHVDDRSQGGATKEQEKEEEGQLRQAKEEQLEEAAAFGGARKVEDTAAVAPAARISGGQSGANVPQQAISSALSALYRTSETTTLAQINDTPPTDGGSENVPAAGLVSATELSQTKHCKSNGSDEATGETEGASLATKQKQQQQRLNGPADEEATGAKLPGLRVWYDYYTQTSAIRLVLIILTFLITQALFSTVDIYLTVWSLSEQNKALVNEISDFNQHQQLIVGTPTGDTRHPHDLVVWSSANNKSNIIEYDLMFGHHEQYEQTHEHFPLLLVSLLLSPNMASVNKTSSFDNFVEMAREIQKAGISPLSSRSSQLIIPAVHQQPSLVIPMSNFFVVHPELVDLFYTATNSTLVANQQQQQHKYIFYQKLQQYYSQSNTGGQKPPYEQAKKFQRNHITGIGSGINQASYGGSTNGDGGESALFTSNAGAGDDEQRNVMVDRNIFEESEAALNVKSIYRPLYLFVNNFTSAYHALTYTLLLIVLFSSSALTNVLSLTSSNKSAISLYKKLTDNALFARLAFFDQNPIGRFLNRATRDIGIIDEAIPYNANQAYDALLQTAATFIVVAAVDINLILPSLIILLIFFIYHSIHVQPTKDIQRLEGISRSPIISHITTTINGLHTIRATKSEERFEQLFIKHQDAHTAVFLLYLGCNRTMAVVLDSLSAGYTGVIVFWAVVSGLTGPSAGLIITSAMLLSGLTQHGVMKLTETESLMTSVERVIEYCSLPQEVNYDRSGKRGKKYTDCHRRDSNNGSKQGDDVSDECFAGKSGLPWPNEGCVEYRQVDLYYNRKLSDKPVLKNISFKLAPGEKVGIIGRTGAGKSSIITTLFRLYDFEGTILIDGVDIKQVDLLDLRSAIGIIPQHPILFSTTIRKNLDPLNVYDDFSIWAALDKAHLRQTISALPNKLDYDIGSCGGDGGGFSSGQKQLICLARVLLRQNSLIVMDEATANVDSTTDAIIQTTIRREFKHCTVITIAHRIETILDCDRIMVLEAGRIVDFDTPEQLATKSNSYFATMLRKASDE